MSDDIKTYLEILELEQGATYLQINKAYHRLKKIFENDTPIISPLTKEFSKKKSNDILRQLGKAHRFLTTNIEKAKPKEENITERQPDAEPEKPLAKKMSFSGRNLRKIRTTLGISLTDISLETKIRIELLKDIESENFDALPNEIYLQAHIRHFAKLLGLNPNKAAEDYLLRFRKHKEGQKEK